MKIKQICFALCSILVTLGVFYACSDKPAEKKPFILFHFWTAGGEEKAIHILLNHFKSANPGLMVAENPVPGGGGVNMFPIVLKLLKKKYPIDILLGHQGSRQHKYINSGYLLPLDSIWEKKKLLSRINPGLRRVLFFKDHYYSIPVNGHRYWLWYNKKLFHSLGLHPPKNYNDLLRTCRLLKLKKPDIIPLALGTREQVWTTYLLDLVLVLTGGELFYQKAVTGRIAYDTDPVFMKALLNLKNLLPYVYQQHPTLSWDEAGALFAKNEAAMYYMGDWLLGYLLSCGLIPEKDFSAIAIPDNIWFGHVDTFHAALKSTHPEAVRQFLMMLLDPEIQKKFNLAKGSISLLKNIPLETYPDPYRRKSAHDIQRNRILFGSFHGGLYNEQFGNRLLELLTLFFLNRNIEDFKNSFKKAAIQYNLAKNSAWFWKNR